MYSGYSLFFFSSRRRHTRCALVTGVQTCALPILGADRYDSIPRHARGGIRRALRPPAAMKAVLPAFARSMVEAELPADIDVAWFTTPDEANAMVVDADIAWVDMQTARYAGEDAARGTRLTRRSTRSEERREGKGR